MPDGPPFPEPVGYLWSWFAEILNGCGSSGWGPPEVTWRDLLAWSMMTGNILMPWESAALIHLSVVYVRVRSEKKPGSK